MKEIPFRRENGLTDTKAGHSEELARLDAQIRSIVKQHEQEISQIKSSHAHEVSLLSVNLKDGKQTLQTSLFSSSVPNVL